MTRRFRFRVNGTGYWRLTGFQNFNMHLRNIAGEEIIVPRSEVTVVRTSSLTCIFGVHMAEEVSGTEEDEFGQTHTVYLCTGCLRRRVVVED